MLIVPVQVILKCKSPSQLFDCILDDSSMEFALNLNYNEKIVCEIYNMVYLLHYLVYMSLIKGQYYSQLLQALYIWNGPILHDTE